MSNISEIDNNFKSENINKENLKIYNINEKPFKLYGIYKPEGESEYIRIPRDVAEKTSTGVRDLNNHTSGGRLRFKTDSTRVVIKCKWEFFGMMPHMAVTGSCGFDLYADGEYVSTFIPEIKYIDGYRPSFDSSTGYESSVSFNDKKMRDIVINFPTYNSVSNLIIGLDADAEVCEGNEYKNKKPVVFYGSSITQGGCVSRPGNMYQNVLSRRLDFDYINLGFSGNARAEDAIADYIAGLDMSLFFYDYDHNAPTVEHLEKTHYKMYKKVRDRHPDIPIIMVSRPNMTPNEKEVNERIRVIENTLKRAKSEGDNNVYFINGMDIFNSHDHNMMTVDGCHPNDFGAFCMAEAFEKLLRKLIG